MKKIDRRIIITVAFLFIVGLSYGIMKYLIAQKEEPPQRMASDIKRYVQTEMVRYSTIVSPVEEDGRVNSVAQIDIVAEASGKILPGKVSLKKGAGFKKGDLLITIYKDEAILSLQSRKSQFMNSLANILPDIRVDYPEYENKFMEFFNSISINSNLPELPQIDDDKLKIFLASRNILSDFYSIRKDELQLSRHSVYAPFDGTFSEVYLEAGAYTNTGGRVAHAIQTDQLEMEVPVKKDDAIWINIGDPVSVYRSNDPLEWKGKVSRKSAYVDPDTQTQTLFIQLVNQSSHPLLNGEYLSAKFPGYPVQGVMEIPRKSVFNNNEVYVVLNDRLEKRTIEIVKTNEKSLIFRGIEEGTLLVTQALINVQEGVMVSTVKDGTAGGPKMSGQQGKQDQLAGKKPDKAEGEDVEKSKENGK